MGRKEGENDYDEFLNKYITKEDMETALESVLPRLCWIYRNFEKPAERLVYAGRTYAVHLEGKTRKYMIVGAVAALTARHKRITGMWGMQGGSAPVNP